VSHIQKKILQGRQTLLRRAFQIRHDICEPANLPEDEGAEGQHHQHRQSQCH
jgi:hypothetical protein